MKTTYSNVKNPRRLSRIIMIISIAGLVAHVALQGIRGFWFWFRLFAYSVSMGLLACLPLLTVRCTVDDQDGTLVTPENKKSPMRISEIDSIIRITNQKGRLRYLNIHEVGVRFVNVRLSPAQAEGLVSHLTALNPRIVVRDRNYL